MVSFSSQNEMSFLYQLLQSHNRSHRKKDHHDHAQHDPVDSKELKVIFPDITHQEFDRKYGNNKRNHHSKKQDKNLCSREMEPEFHDF